MKKPIELALRAMNSASGRRESFHHPKGYQHKYNEPCPLEKQWHEAQESLSQWLILQREKGRGE